MRRRVSFIGCAAKNQVKSIFAGKTLEPNKTSRYAAPRILDIMKRNQFVILIFLGLAAACSPKIDNRGYVKNVEWKDQIVIGQTTKDDILQNFGSPSSQSSFGDESWYYITAHKETMAFFKPEITEQNVVRLTFDANGVVTNLETFDKSNAQEFDVAKRITPTEGHSLGFFEQILGNVGRFNKGGSDSPIAPGRKPSSHY
jgi:outer membrane protein assembly factor BamE (lipoprotein component of BamABCDE complex)